jgi:hypothetical protein
MRRSVLALLLALGTGIPATAARHYQVLDRPLDSLYFGRVAHCDLPAGGLGPRILRKAGEEVATVNMPLGPGDTLVTAPDTRCEVEFDTGTRVLLDGSTTVRLETILAPSLSSSRKLTNLALETGRIRIRYRPYGGDEVFQVLTGNAAVKIEANASVDVQTGETSARTRLEVAEGHAVALFGPEDGRTRQQRLGPGDTAVVQADHSLERGKAGASDQGTFAAWSQSREDARVRPSADSRPLPATLQGLSPAVRDFAERVSRTRGEWVWSPTKAHAWRPHASRTPGWRPYSVGRWTAFQGAPFWVSDEDWGWVPYHLGYWIDDADLGWLWLPGSTFAPAWVTWGGCGDAYAWWPFGPADWLRYRSTLRPVPLPPFCDAIGEAWYSYPWEHDITPPPARPPEYAKRRGGSGPTPEPPPRRPRPDRGEPPRELRMMRTELGRLTDGLGSGPASVPGLPPAVPQRTRPETVDRRERIEDRAASSPASAGEPTRNVPASPASPPIDAVRVVEPRFRDWNPDVRAARAMGGRIGYDSGANRVFCEGCRTENGGVFFGSGSSGSSSADGSAGSGSSGANGPGASGPMAGAAGAAKAGPIDR